MKSYRSLFVLGPAACLALLLTPTGLEAGEGHGKAEKHQDHAAHGDHSAHGDHAAHGDHGHPGDGHEKGRGEGHEKARGEGHHKAHDEGRDEIYGEAPTLVEVTPIGRLLADPDRYVGKTVRIEGQVLDVCPMKGCWMDLGRDGERIQVKVDDDVIVFPADAKGRVASAQGVVEAVEMDREGYVRYLEHLAEERGEAFDLHAHKIGNGPYRIYRIKGTGAEIR